VRAGRGTPGRPSVLTVDGLSVQVVRKPIRHLYLRVRDGGVVVTAPANTSDQRVAATVRARRGWLDARLAQQTAARDAHDELAASGRVLVWGRPTPVEDGGRGRWHVEAVNEALVVTAPVGAPEATRTAAVDRWLRGELAAEVGRLVELWQARLGVRPGEVALRTMTSRWGSCQTRTGRLTFSTRLVHRDPALLEYVVVHELVHLLHADHGPAFQAEMDRHLPFWRTRRRDLNRG